MEKKIRGFQFTDEDMELIEKIRSNMSKTQGKVTVVAALRYAIRLATQETA
jgi:hypothetical protein